MFLWFGFWCKWVDFNYVVIGIGFVMVVSVWVFEVWCYVKMYVFVGIVVCQFLVILVGIVYIVLGLFMGLVNVVVGKIVVLVFFSGQVGVSGCWFYGVVVQGVMGFGVIWVVFGYQFGVVLDWVMNVYFGIVGNFLVEWVIKYYVSGVFVVLFDVNY